MQNDYDDQVIFACLDLPKEDSSEQNDWDERLMPQNQIQCQIGKSQPKDYNKHQNGEVQKAIPTGLSNQDYEEPQHSPQFQVPQQQIQCEKEKVFRDISYLQSSEVAIQNRRGCKKGQSYQTQNIGKHLKSITFHFLTMLYQARFLDPSQKQAIDAFNLSNGSIKDFQQLFSFPELSKICMDFYSSKNYIVWVMNSTKMDFYSKLMMVKYGQKLRSLTYTQVKSWKLEIQ